jgi:hypothetical protein
VMARRDDRDSEEQLAAGSGQLAANGTAETATERSDSKGSGRCR